MAEKKTKKGVATGLFVSVIAPEKWEQIRQDFIRDNISYAELERRHGVSKNSIARRSKKEDWRRAREEYLLSVSRGRREKKAEETAETLVKVDVVADKLLAKISQAVDELEIFAVEDYKRTKVREYDEQGNCTLEDETFSKSMKKFDAKVIDRAGLKAVTSALKDLKEVKMLRTMLEEEEQRARIAKLQKEVEEDKKDLSIVIQMGDAAESFGD